MPILVLFAEIAALCWRYGRLIAFIGAPLSLVVWLFNNIDAVEASIDSLNSQLSNISDMLTASPVHSLMSKVNLIFPLSEFNTYWHVWVQLYLICLGIRWSRSWIPGLGG